MRESHAGERTFDQFPDEWRSADFNEPRGRGHQLRFAQVGADREYPAGFAEHALVRNFAIIEVIFSAGKWDRNTVSRNNRFQVRADVPVELLEAFAQIIVIVQ